MGVQFGRWNFDGQTTAPDYFERASTMLAPYGPDGADSFCTEGVTVLYREFRTTKESAEQAQPHKTRSGAVFTWDGRLDNRAELLSELGDAVSPDFCDVLIVAAAYERWETRSFERLIGDWALSLWLPSQRTLVLAKDPIGTRHLYYVVDDFHVTWSTILDPLVLLAGRSFKLDEEYLAGWLSFFPSVRLTPYVGIHSVPPSCFISLREGSAKVTKYWDFDAQKEIRYHTDAEYEEHFRCVFTEAVKRRLRSDKPVVAELSGGMDSSSIVCTADTILAGGSAETPRLDTVSYFDDSEPNWNERPYFTKVEEKRGRAGCHINVGAQQGTLFELDDAFAATPGSGGRIDQQFVQCMTSGGYRVLLSGIGGDEVTGGVPTPVPELADLLARARFAQLAHQLKTWALNKRRPWFHLLLETASGFLPQFLVGVPKYKRPAPWLNCKFVNRNRRALEGYGRRWYLGGSRPTFQENLGTLQMLRRQLASEPMASRPPCEKRYPYLDRSLLEFLYAVPREQLVRPGQRRSLMRRALAGIVPSEVLQRKQKASVGRGIIRSISSQESSWRQVANEMLSSSLGIVDAGNFRAALQDAQLGREVSLVLLMRTVGLELWLRNSQQWTTSRHELARARHAGVPTRTEEAQARTDISGEGLTLS